MDYKKHSIILTVAFVLQIVSVSFADWKTDANARIEQLRKTDFRITVVDPGNPSRQIDDIRVEIEQVRHHFAFGSAINYNVTNPDYANFFKDTFEWAVMENESKWYANQRREDNVTYEVADRIVDFCNANDITLRGHCIFWAKEKYVQNWLQAKDKQQLEQAVVDRLTGVVNHFKGTFVHWDVNNEMCDGTYFRDRLGPGIRPCECQSNSTALGMCPANCLLCAQAITASVRLHCWMNNCSGRHLFSENYPHLQHENSENMPRSGARWIRHLI